MWVDVEDYPRWVFKQFMYFKELNQDIEFVIGFDPGMLTYFLEGYNEDDDVVIEHGYSPRAITTFEVLNKIAQKYNIVLEQEVKEKLEDFAKKSLEKHKNHGMAQGIKR